ncbi:unnamed protein product [Caretta caretta]
MLDRRPSLPRVSAWLGFRCLPQAELLLIMPGGGRGAGCCGDNRYQVGTGAEPKGSACCLPVGLFGGWGAGSKQSYSPDSAPGTPALSAARSSYATVFLPAPGLRASGVIDA